MLTYKFSINKRGTSIKELVSEEFPCLNLFIENEQMKAPHLNDKPLKQKIIVSGDKQECEHCLKKLK